MAAQRKAELATEDLHGAQMAAQRELEEGLNADDADEDLLIERSDLGPGAATLVAKGDPIPPALAGLPRRPRQPGPPKRRRT